MICCDFLWMPTWHFCGGLVGPFGGVFSPAATPYRTEELSVCRTLRSTKTNNLSCFKIQNPQIPWFIVIFCSTLPNMIKRSKSTDSVDVWRLRFEPAAGASLPLVARHELKSKTEAVHCLVGWLIKGTTP